MNSAENGPGYQFPGGHFCVTRHSDFFCNFKVSVDVLKPMRGQVARTTPISTV